MEKPTDSGKGKRKKHEDEKSESTSWPKSKFSAEQMRAHGTQIVVAFRGGMPMAEC